MNLDRAVLLLAGTMTLLGALLIVLVSQWWLLLTTFVGLNRLQSSITRFARGRHLPPARSRQRVGLSLDDDSDGPGTPRLPRSTSDKVSWDREDATPLN